MLSDGHVAGYETALRAEYNGLLAVHEANNDRVRVTNELKAAEKRNDTTKEELQKMKAKVGRTGRWTLPYIKWPVTVHHDNRGVCGTPYRPCMRAGR